MDQSGVRFDDRDALRRAVAEATLANESEIVKSLGNRLSIGEAGWLNIANNSAEYITQIRSEKSTPLIDQFLTEYGLSSEEGVQLMRLAEALSRSTDATTANQLIADKIMDRDWLAHVGKGRSFLMQMTGIALHLSDLWLRWSSGRETGVGGAIANLGNSVLRSCTRTAIRALSSQFVFAESLPNAIKRVSQYGQKGYSFSFDMLGEAARTKSDAAQYYHAYAIALEVVADQAKSDDPKNNNGISIKLSALHPRYEYGHAYEVVPEICEMLRPLLVKARAANVQITIDAEEAERLDISMEVLERLVVMPELHGWHGLGFVVQAYQRRAMPLIKWLAVQSQALGSPLFIRLVKGAYWDSEIKRAQELGLDSYPVFTRKESTDLSYLACAEELLKHPDKFSPQFATHNAHSIAAIEELARPDQKIEIQRLFGMGQQLHDMMLGKPNITSRIYAPVGTQKDLLSYLIRRLLENGANSSFINKLTDKDVPISRLNQSPITAIENAASITNGKIPKPRDYLGNERTAAAGYDFSNPLVREAFQRSLNSAGTRSYKAAAIVAGKSLDGDAHDILNPADRTQRIGQCVNADRAAADNAVAAAKTALISWRNKPLKERAAMLDEVANLLEQRAATFHYLAIKEAGKSWSDAVDEVREAVDFCRYYAEQIGHDQFANREALGVTLCISPWNFPLAIFLGQVVAALAAGNSVIAKPAEQTPLIAAEAVRLIHDAGVDSGALNLIPGHGKTVGEALVSNPDVAAICFTGSTPTAKHIALRLAETGRPLTPFIAETGGINAMIVDSSALLEQTVDAIISSAFQSAGQRCSALRILCLQDDIASDCIKLLDGAIDALRMGDPIDLSTDIGPVIDGNAKQKIEKHIGKLKEAGRQLSASNHDGPQHGNFISPAAFKLKNFDDLEEEIFGPVLHVITFAASEKIELIHQINNSGYGLTLGIQSRIDRLCDTIASVANVGNIYVNRNQIGAVVGTQPFGGHGLSGTGPKAGGPLYLKRLSRRNEEKTKPVPQAKMEHTDRAVKSDWDATFQMGVAAAKKTSPSRVMGARKENWPAFEHDGLQQIFDRERAALLANIPPLSKLPSTAGETNHYSLSSRGLIVSFAQSADEAITGCLRAVLTGNAFLQVNTGDPFPEIGVLAQYFTGPCFAENVVQEIAMIDPDDLETNLLNHHLGAIFLSRSDDRTAEFATLIARSNSPILPILTSLDSADRFVHEKTVTRNIAAAGGDVSLLNA